MSDLAKIDREAGNWSAKATAETPAKTDDDSQSPKVARDYVAELDVLKAQVSELRKVVFGKHTE